MHLWAWLCSNKTTKTGGWPVFGRATSASSPPQKKLYYLSERQRNSQTAEIKSPPFASSLSKYLEHLNLDQTETRDHKLNFNFSMSGSDPLESSQVPLRVRFTGSWSQEWNLELNSGTLTCQTSATESGGFFYY